MYNGVLSGVSLDGTLFFYPNPLESDGRVQVQQGPGRSARPGSASPAVPGTSAGSCRRCRATSMPRRATPSTSTCSSPGEAKIDLGGQAVAIRQETRYPWDGTIRLTVDPERKREFALHVRIPGWAQNRPVPTDLYRYEERGAAKVDAQGQRQARRP